MLFESFLLEAHDEKIMATRSLVATGEYILDPLARKKRNA